MPERAVLSTHNHCAPARPAGGVPRAVRLPGAGAAGAALRGGHAGLRARPDRGPPPPPPRVLGPAPGLWTPAPSTGRQG